MKITLTLIFVFTLVISNICLSQNLYKDKLLKLEAHPSDNSKFIAKYYNKHTRSIVEYLTMATKTPNITVATFDSLRKERLVFAHGEYYEFYPGSKKKFEVNFENGKRIGEGIGYYQTGEIKYKVTYPITPKGKCTFYFKNGSISEITNYENGKIDGLIKKYYPNGNKFSFTNYSRGIKEGKYQSFHLNGKTKRKAKFKNDSIISSNCFDVYGNKIDCNLYLIQPTIEGGFEALKKEIEEIDFTFNAGQTDTSTFRIIIDVDTTGHPILTNYFTKFENQMYNQLIDWVDQLPVFSKVFIDDFPKPYSINLAFPICNGEPLWLGEPTALKHNPNFVVKFENKPTWFWEFPNPADRQIFFIVDNMPSFPGGEKALRNFISRNISYPKLASRNRIQGKVYVTFVVDKDGSVTDVKIAKGVHPALDAEAMRVVKKMPKWIPGSTRGKATRVSYTVPINFETRSFQTQSSHPYIRR